jgi:hypothetical protein
MAKKIFDVGRLASRLGRIKGVQAVVCRQAGGDHDTFQITLQPLALRADGSPHDHVTVTGFTLEPIGPRKDQVPVDMVEVQDGLNSRGGLSSSHLRTCLLYGRVCSILRRRGFEVVPQLRDYF